MSISTVTFQPHPFKSSTFDKFHSGLDLKISRVMCGVGWPSDNRPGAVVVVAEELIISPTSNPKLYLLGEYESHSISELLDKAIFFKDDMKINSFFAQKGQERYVAFRNKNARDTKSPEIHVQAVQQNEDLEFYLVLIADLTRIENPRLNLGKQSRLPGILGQLPASVAGLKLDDYPLLAALGFAIDPLARQPYRETSYGSAPNRCQTEYDLFPAKRRQ